MDIAATAFDEMPTALIAELEGAGLDADDVYAQVVRALAEDVPTEDVTSVPTIPASDRGVADFVTREPGTVAGLAIAELVFRYVLGAAVRVERPVADGEAVAARTTVLTVYGATRSLLIAERTALNFLCHLSGVATGTARWVAALEGTSARVRDTRKTIPGWRRMEKYAVRCGGGVNHRESLSDQALIKDNHVLAAGGVVAAYRAVQQRYADAQPPLPIQVEVDSLDQLRELLEIGVDSILLDNMTPDQLAQAVRLSDGRATLEASGGLTLESAAAVAATGVDFIAVGALTHSAKVYDIGMDLRPDGA
ncbi:carboxylating nicotinate-nucleotide diphosphorylase [Nocardioides sp. Bht2]|uniref:carboxylating nicotinate-nucleotide diphosphorylase n=1 Tax=Nocardioides sp. Bht2 TaxID=3392297 RepID=UPI0039B52ADA